MSAARHNDSYVPTLSQDRVRTTRLGQHGGKVGQTAGLNRSAARRGRFCVSEKPAPKLEGHRRLTRWPSTSEIVRKWTVVQRNTVSTSVGESVHDAPVSGSATRPTPFSTLRR